eukprot:COSAG05_NODE_4103_length_1673_cov_2.257306_1_plen_557_part_11
MVHRASFSNAYMLLPAAAAALAAAATLSVPANSTMLTMTNGVSLELLQDGSNGEFLGIGAVSVGDTAVRTAGSRPWTVAASVTPVTRMAIDTCPLYLTRVEQQPDGIDVHLVACGISEKTQQAVFQWSFRVPVVAVVATTTMTTVGFDYFVRWQATSSSQRPLHKLLDRFSFSLNGSVNGRLWATQREVYNLQRLSRPSTTAGVLNSSTILTGWDYPEQRLYPESRIGAEDGLDFLSAEHVSFVRFPLTLALIYKNLSRTANSSELHCDDWHMSKRTRNFTTVNMAVRVIAHPEQQQVGDSGSINAWIYARDALSEAMAGEPGSGGLSPTPTRRPQPTITLSGFGENNHTTGQLEPPTAAAVVEWCKEYSIRRVWIWSIWVTDYTKGHSNLTGVPAESDAVWFLRIDDLHYNSSALAQLGQALDAAGIDLVLWIPGGHLSVLSPLRKENPRWPVRKPDGSEYTYVYKRVGANRYDQGYSEYMLASLKRLQPEIKFRGVFLDSFQVMGCEVIDYSDSLWPPNLDGAAAFVRRLQDELGLVTFAETNFPLTLPFVGGQY